MSKAIKSKRYIAILLMCVAVSFAIGIRNIGGARAVEPAETEFLANGAQIRLMDIGTENGIRFNVIMEKTYYETVTAKELAETGVLVVPVELLDGRELTLEEVKTEDNGKHASDKKITGLWENAGKLADNGHGIYVADESGAEYMSNYAYLYNIPDTAYDVEIAFRGYITTEEGTSYTETLVRSMSEVAYQAIENNPEYEESLNGYLYEYDITFDDLGEISTETVRYGYKVNEPSSPTQEEIPAFDGWYLGEDKYDFNSPVKRDLNLVAKYTGQGTYNVNIWTQELFGEYVLSETLPFSGDYGAIVEYDAPEKAGYNLNQAKSNLSGTVTVKEPLELNAYYTKWSPASAVTINSSLPTPPHSYKEESPEGAERPGAYLYENTGAIGSVLGARMIFTNPDENLSPDTWLVMNVFFSEYSKDVLEVGVMQGSDPWGDYENSPVLKVFEENKTEILDLSKENITGKWLTLAINTEPTTSASSISISFFRNGTGSMYIENFAFVTGSELGTVYTPTAVAEYYKVQDNGEYLLSETEILEVPEIGATVTASAKDYAGFILNESISVTSGKAWAGLLILKLYYTKEGIIWQAASNITLTKADDTYYATRHTYEAAENPLSPRDGTYLYKVNETVSTCQGTRMSISNTEPVMGKWCLINVYFENYSTKGGSLTVHKIGGADVNWGDVSFAEIKVFDDETKQEITNISCANLNGRWITVAIKMEITDAASTSFACSMFSNYATGSMYVENYAFVTEEVLFANYTLSE